MLNLNKTSTSKRTIDSGHSESKSKSESSRNSRNCSAEGCFGIVFSLIVIALLTTLMICSHEKREAEYKTKQHTEECHKPKRGSYIIRYKLEVEYPNGRHGVIIKNIDVGNIRHNSAPDEYRFTMKEFHLNGMICITEYETLSDRIHMVTDIFDEGYHSIDEIKSEYSNYCDNLAEYLKYHGICDVYSTTFERYGDLTYKVIGLLDSDVIDKYDNLIYDCTTKTHYKSLKTFNK